MRKLNVILVATLMTSAAFAQSTTKPKTTTAATPHTAQTAKKPTTPAAPAGPKAIFETSMGNITCTLFPDKAPMTVENFIGLAEGTKEWKNPVSGATKTHTPLYDGTIFHRVIPNFMIQGGDPAGNGSGDPGYKFKDEFSDLRFDQPGRLAMANSGPNTNGSQFFITDVPTPWLNGKHTIFGQCAPISTIKAIEAVPRDAMDKPLKPVRLLHVKIVKAGAAAPAKKAVHPTVKHPAKAPVKK